MDESICPDCGRDMSLRHPANGPVYVCEPCKRIVSVVEDDIRR